MSVNQHEIKFEGDVCNFPDTAIPQVVSIFWLFHELIELKCSLLLISIIETKKKTVVRNVS